MFADNCLCLFLLSDGAATCVCICVGGYVISLGTPSAVAGLGCLFAACGAAVL